MKILPEKNVFDEALDRIRYLFDEFPNIVVGMSGGKDSTVAFELAMRVTRERGRLPLRGFLPRLCSKDHGSRFGHGSHAYGNRKKKSFVRPAAEVFYVTGN
jgi:NH3-dependent NAD+ synthetase